MGSKHSRVCAKDRRRICDELMCWPGLCLSSDKSFKLPDLVDGAIAGLPLSTDSFRCTMEPASCAYICRCCRRGLKKHWREVHGWSTCAGKRGGSHSAVRMHGSLTTLTNRCVTAGWTSLTRRVNSFMQRPHPGDRPLLVKLQKSMWRRYTRIWKALLCFIYSLECQEVLAWSAEGKRGSPKLSKEKPARPC